VGTRFNFYPQWRTLSVVLIAFLLGFVASQCTQRVYGSASRSVRLERIVDDRPIDYAVDAKSFNCAGFAFRAYRYMSLEDVRTVLSRCRALSSHDAACPPGWVKIWAWEYDVHRETDNGWTSTSRPDGHVVAGRTSRTDGSGPDLVYGKYAAGPITGPDVPASWAPPAREEVGVNASGHHVFVVREHVVERWYCAPENVLQRPPSPAASANVAMAR
jgi:hypothetical protein